MNELEVSKIVGAVCVALLAFMGLSQMSQAIYAPHSAHGDEPSYRIAGVAGDAAAPVEEEPQIDVAALVAAADPSRGPRLFRSCQSCHNIGAGEDHKTGPSLWGVVGREIGSAEGFGYSAALRSHDETWTVENLNGFLEKPRVWAQGTSMGYNGMRKIEDRADLIAWLSQQSD